MSSNGEHREQLERELAHVGIKADVGRTEGGHMRVRWTHEGKLRSILTSWTPSDHRSTLNARSKIRQILREDGVYDQPHDERPKPLQRALTVPIGRDPNCVRIERLEEDIAALLDIISELTGKLNVKFDDAPVAAVTAADHPPVVLPPVVLTKAIRAMKAVPKARGPHPKCKHHSLLLAMDYSLVPIKLIARRTGRSYVAISVALGTLKKRGIVENPQRGMWRKVAPRTDANGAHRANGVNEQHA